MLRGNRIRRQSLFLLFAYLVEAEVCFVTAGPVLGLHGQLGAGASESEIGQCALAGLTVLEFFGQALASYANFKDFSVLAHGIRGFVAAQIPLEVERLPALARARGDLLPVSAAVGVVGADRDPFLFPVFPAFLINPLAGPGSSPPGFRVPLHARGLVGEGKVEHALAEGVADSARVDFLPVTRDEASVATVNFLIGVVLKKGVAPRVGALPRLDLVTAHVGDVEGGKVDLPLFELVRDLLGERYAG